MVDLTALKVIVRPLDPAHPFRAVIENLPQSMPASDYLAVLPVLWSLAERPC